MYVYVCHVYVGVCGRQKMMSNPLELVTFHFDLPDRGTSRSSGRLKNILNHKAISPDFQIPHLLILVNS